MHFDAIISHDITHKQRYLNNSYRLNIYQYTAGCFQNAKACGGLNGLPWKQTEIILSFLSLLPKTAFWTLLFTVEANPFPSTGSCPQ